MKLNLKDKVLILKSLLPDFDNKRGIELSSSIKNKLEFTSDEANLVEVKDFEDGHFNLIYKNGFEISGLIEKDYDLSKEEIEYLQQKVKFLDENYKFTSFTYDTYVKILNTTFTDDKE